MRRSYAFSLATGKDYEGAIREMSLAATMFEKAKRELDLVESYVYLAMYHELKKEPDYGAALEYLSKALVIAQELHDDKEQAKINMDIGFAYEIKGQFDSAIGSFTTAQHLAEKVDYWEVYARSLWGMAEIAENKQEADAEGLYARAAALFSKAGILDAESQVLVKRATMLQRNGHSEEALRVLLNARDLAEQSKSNTAALTAYSSLGFAYEAAGQYPNALLAFTAARDKATADNNLTAQAYADVAMGGVCQIVGEWTSALEHSLSALSEFKSLGNENGELSAYSLLMAVYTERSSELKDFQKASSLYKEASSLKAFQSQSIGIGMQMVEMYTQTKQYKEWIENATLLLSRCTAAKDNVCVAHAHLSLAEGHSAEGQQKAAQEELKRAGPLVSAANDYYLSGRFLYVRARVERNADELEASIKDYSVVVQMIGAVQGGPDARQSSTAFENYSFIFDELVSTLYQRSLGQTSLQTDYAALALQTAEANKAHSFDEVWGTRFSDAVRRRLLSTAVREKESELQVRKAKLSSELRDVLAGETHPTRPADQIRSDLVEVDSQLKAFVADLREKYPAYALIR